MRNSICTATALLITLILFGCGQSGPLYVSGNPSTIQPSSDQTNAEDEEKDEAPENVDQ